jgi:tetratricopeptide (TPR) repeat protein
MNFPALSTGRPRPASPGTRHGFVDWRMAVVCALALVTVLALIMGNQTRITMPSATGPASEGATNAPAPEASLAPASPFDEDDPFERAEQLALEGTELMNAGQMAAAVEKFQAGLKLAPDSPDTFYNMGFALSRLGRSEEAMAAYREAIELVPDYSEAHNNLGNLLMSAGRLDEAVRHFNLALEADPEQASAQNNLGTALSRMGRVNEATIHFMKAAQLQPGYIEAQFNLASAYFQQGRIDESLMQLQKVLSMQPNFEPALRLMARVRQRQALQQR